MATDRREPARGANVRISDRSYAPRHHLVTVLAFAFAGCLPDDVYVCRDDAQCAGGTCQPEGHCSFADDGCASGQRFDDSAGELGNRCVGELPAVPPPPPPPEQGACPAGYAAVDGMAHRYRVLGLRSWDDARDRCASDGAYLAIPDDAAELAAIRDLASTSVWIGIDDRATEGSFVTQLGTVPAFLPWGAEQPNNLPLDADCLRIDGETGALHDELCITWFAAVCECAPEPAPA